MPRREAASAAVVDGAQRRGRGWRRAPSAGRGRGGGARRRRRRRRRRRERRGRGRRGGAPPDGGARGHGGGRLGRAAAARPARHGRATTARPARHGRVATARSARCGPWPRARGCIKKEETSSRPMSDRAVRSHRPPQVPHPPQRRRPKVRRTTHLSADHIAVWSADRWVVLVGDSPTPRVGPDAGRDGIADAHPRRRTRRGRPCRRNIIERPRSIGGCRMRQRCVRRARANAKRQRRRYVRCGSRARPPSTPSAPPFPPLGQPNDLPPHPPLLPFTPTPRPRC